MVHDTRLLVVLDPSEGLNPRASELKLNEVTVMMDKQWTVHLISSQKTRYKNLSCNYQVHKARMLSSPNSILSRALYLLFSICKGARLVKKHKIHAVIAKEGHLVLGLVSLAIKKMTGTRCILRVNENSVLELLLFIQRLRTPLLSRKAFLRIIELTARKMETYVFKHADWIVTQGPIDFQRIKRVTDKVNFVPLWVNSQKFRPLSSVQKSQMRKALIKVEDETKVFLFVGRLHLEKDIDTLFYAFEKLLETRMDIVLVMIGTGPEEERCKELTRKLGIAEKVKFLGYITHDELPKYYNAADVYILTSIWEEWSNTIMEAMACGLPVIATKVGGNPYLVKDNVTGFLVPPKNPSLLAEKMAYVLNNHADSAKISSNGRLEIKKYSKESAGELYKTAISQAIDRNLPPRDIK